MNVPITFVPGIKVYRGLTPLEEQNRFTEPLTPKLNPDTLLRHLIDGHPESYWEVILLQIRTSKSTTFRSFTFDREIAIAFATHCGTKAGFLVEIHVPNAHPVASIGPDKIMWETNNGIFWINPQLLSPPASVIPGMSSPFGHAIAPAFGAPMIPGTDKKYTLQNYLDASASARHEQEILLSWGRIQLQPIPVASKQYRGFVPFSQLKP